MSLVNPADLAYGSDRTGLVWGYLFEADRPPRQIEGDAALQWLATAGAARPSGFVWLHASIVAIG
jgi:zinc transporter